MKAGLRRWQRRLAGLFSGLGGAPVSCRMLLISDEREYTSEQQFAPIWRHQAALRARLGLAVRWLPLDAAMRRPPGFFSRFDAVGLKLSFRRPREEVEAIAARLRAPTTKLVYFDGDDDSAILWPGLLDVSDLYVKKHIFADPAAYAERFIGKSNLTTHVARMTGRSFADDIIPEAGGIDPGRLARLHLGWSIALDDKIAALTPHRPEAERPIDVCGRAWATPESWLHGLRAPAVAALEAAAHHWSVNVPRGRVSQADYDRELRSAKICVSPFGYGEICWRDFEAIMSGCLLVKPVMDHVRSLPDLFVAGETYLPVAWDYADLEAVCAPFLKDDRRRIAIARRAQDGLLEALSADWFVDRMTELIRRL